MSTKNPIDHHLRRKLWQKKRRLVVDALFIIIFFCAITGIFFAYQMNARTVFAEKQKITGVLARQATKERESEQKQRALEKELRRVREEAMQKTDPLVPTSTSLLEPEPPSGLVDEVSPPGIPSSQISASGTTEGIAGFVQFEDVTVSRYENSRLGFVMEIPSGWRMAYEHSDEVLFANDTYWFGVFLSDVVKKKEAMWVRIVRPCTSTTATSTIFVFATTSDTSIRETTSCIPPFLVTLGYRADVADYILRERFLLSIGRTIYPMVSSVPPYLPLR
jgi:hypothetical protein